MSGPVRPFRFGVNMVSFGSGEEFRQRCRRAEEQGYDTVHVADHLGMSAPFPALAAAAEVTERPRLGTFVLNAGFWNPALLAREVVTVDQLSGGRFELGLGAGYVKAEHDRAGLPWSSPGGRVDHLEHLVAEVTRLLADPEHTPRPVQEPVPLLIGGNGDRVLRLAARTAAVAAFTGGRQVAGEPDGTMALISPAELEERTRAAMDFAEDRAEPPELNYLVQYVAQTADPGEALERLRPYGPGMSDEELLAHPALLLGSPKEMAEQLRAHRERFGFSYFTVLDPFMDVFAPVVEELGGS
ncbi:TIGR03621 family F420-dependent LLM class oxidoreductase [Streptomyces sp. A73]|uniref:TIGR03621 family F420-dependent LLM class oxidoreductase n=1 Tax=Streptomyces sp. B15 TaxID=1537797 RepID=UPI001B378281|nr:TIGR03621 family F420-dependent LLM class oxidoreductase [Streptomyces sp. B15]MBQ1124892.1 TIGR03621 family F420-dependent LLM class oxidoreductase [Streptomyces sp. B15]MBQ1160539.1 TIGR03621 family F420-dependent LLM class oxidoreductase [Streptomyces sp. A73]